VRRSAPFLLALLLAAPASAQCGLTVEECRPDAPRWVGEFAALSANAVLGGLTSGVTRRLAGGSFSDAFLRGLLGGSAVYAGKRIAAERFDGAGLIGRQVAAAGTSMVRNAGNGVHAFDRLLIPFGPFRVDLSPRDGHWSVRTDAVALGWIVYGIAESQLELDWGRSVGAGTAVFRTRGTVISFDGEEAHAAGVTNAGVIYVADVPAYGERVYERSLAHERIHVLQQDFIAAAWTDPLVDALLGRTAPTRLVRSHISVNVSTELMRALGRLFPKHDDRPWEIESIFFAR